MVYEYLPGHAHAMECRPCGALVDQVRQVRLLHVHVCETSAEQFHKLTVAVAGWECRHAGAEPAGPAAAAAQPD